MDSALQLSSSEEVDTGDPGDPPPQLPQFKELLEVMTHAVKLKIDWPAEECAELQTSRLDEYFLRAKQSPMTQSLPFFPDLHSVWRSWARPFSARIFISSSDYYGNVGGLNECGYRAMPISHGAQANS